MKNEEKNGQSVKWRRIKKENHKNHKNGNKKGQKQTFQPFNTSWNVSVFWPRRGVVPLRKPSRLWGHHFTHCRMVDIHLFDSFHPKALPRESSFLLPLQSDWNIMVSKLNKIDSSPFQKHFQVCCGPRLHTGCQQPNRQMGARKRRLRSNAFYFLRGSHSLPCKYSKKSWIFHLHFLYRF